MALHVDLILFSLLVSVHMLHVCSFHGGINGEDFREVSLGVGLTVSVNSPNYPDQYNNSLDILWTVSAPVDHRIEVHFTDFDTAVSSDVLVIGSGTSAVEPGGVELLVHAGSTIPDDVQSPGRYLWIRFTTGTDHGSDGVLSATAPDVVHRGFCMQLTSVERAECTDGQFECTNGFCVPDNAKCDGINDCLDFSDEEGCPACVTVEFQSCADKVLHNLTFFPNLLAENASDAEQKYQTTVSQLSSCHPYFEILFCHVLYEECPLSGLTLGPCFSDCVDVENACKEPFEASLQQEWPIKCEGFTNWQSAIDGGCLRESGAVADGLQCGTRPGYLRGTSPRILGGVTARPGELPWMASIKDLSCNGPSTHTCGAALIGSQWAITAARCVFGYVDEVVFGDLDRTSPSPDHISAQPDEVFVYPGYNSTSGHGDVALIKLGKAITYNPSVRPVCLSGVLNITKAYRQCIVGGWGITSSLLDVPSQALRKAVVRLIDDAICTEQYNGTITEDMFCAGNNDICDGDHGGPLTCESGDGRWHILGVASGRNQGCRQEGRSGVYANVSQFFPFIQMVLNGEFESSNILVQLNSTEGVTITSPNYPTNYPSDVRMVWKVTAPTGHYVRALFSDIRLATEESGGGDDLYIGDGLFPLSSTERARITGSNSSLEVTSKGRHFWIMLITDGINSDRGFQVLLLGVSNGSTNACVSNPCLNEGSCMLSAEGYVCLCSEGYNGTNCENGPRCIKLTINGNSAINGNYYGSIAGQAIKFKVSTEVAINSKVTINGAINVTNACTSSPCFNGGSCIAHAHGYTCLCSQGYTGTNCLGSVCTLDGIWYNDCNDRLSLSRTSTGLILGEYTTYLELLIGYTVPSMVIGYADHCEDHPSFGLVVTRDNGATTTSWSGQCHETVLVRINGAVTSRAWRRTHPVVGCRRVYNEEHYTQECR